MWHQTLCSTSVVIELRGLYQSLSELARSANSTGPILVDAPNSCPDQQRQPAGLYALPKDSYVKQKQEGGETVW